jgi:hypothetical protein
VREKPKEDETAHGGHDYPAKVARNGLEKPVELWIILRQRPPYRGCRDMNRRRKEWVACVSGPIAHRQSNRIPVDNGLSNPINLLRICVGRRFAIAEKVGEQNRYE